MNDIIKSHEAKKGFQYRLFPNRYRSRYLVVKVVGVSDEGYPIFLYTDHEKKISRVIKDVDKFENVQLVSKFSNG